MPTYDMLLCPKCKKSLSQQGQALKCEANHSYDIAASGYVNLLLTTRSGNFIGDNKAMIAARREFLEAGYYRGLGEAIRETIGEYGLEPDFNLIDAGCGEGYYTRLLRNAFPEPSILGVDISRHGCLAASKQDRESIYITATASAMPVKDNWANTILSVCAPAFGEEFRRLLQPCGKVLMVAPGRNHLMELKEAVYDEAYPNREEKHILEGFQQAGSRRISYPITIDKPEHIRQLFAMTPYARRTPREGIARLEALEKITVTVEFLLLTFE